MPTPKKSTTKHRTPRTTKLDAKEHTVNLTATPVTGDTKATPTPRGTGAKPDAPAPVTEYIGALATDQQRYARKAWRHATGQRGTAPSLRGITQEQARTIRERIAALTT